MLARFKKSLFLAPILLLSSVACWQIVRAHTSELTPWKGGGFGMFSTVDQPATRYVKCFIVQDGHSHALRIPDSFGNKIKRIKADPSQERLEKMTDELLQLRPDQLLANINLISQQDLQLESSSGNEIGKRELQVEIWKYGFDAEKNQISARKLFVTSRTF